MACQLAIRHLLTLTLTSLNIVLAWLADSGCLALTWRGSCRPVWVRLYSHCGRRVAQTVQTLRRSQFVGINGWFAGDVFAFHALQLEERLSATALFAARRDAPVPRSSYCKVFRLVVLPKAFSHLYYEESWLHWACEVVFKS